MCLCITSLAVFVIYIILFLNVTVYFSFSYDLIRFDLDRKDMLEIKPFDMSCICLHCNEQCERDSRI